MVETPGVRSVAVAPDRWLAALDEQVAAGFGLFEFLTAVDWPELGQIEVICGLRGLRLSPPVVLVGTRVARDQPRLPSASAVIAGANWAEREAAEMFGMVFTDHPDPTPLLLDKLGEWPLRRSSPLVTRLDSRWPGLDDPADRPPPGAVAARRRSGPAVPGNNPQWQT